jgi:hypothetical protein
LTSVEAARLLADDVAVAPGPRVRVLAPAFSDRPIVGQLTGSDEATLTILRTGGGLVIGWPFRRGAKEVLSLARGSVTRLDRSIHPSRKRLGAMIGGLVGAAVGVVIVARGTRGSEAGACNACSSVVAVIAAPFALVGAAIAPGERWTAEDPARIRVGFSRAPDGRVGVRLSMTF